MLANTSRKNTLKRVIGTLVGGYGMKSVAIILHLSPFGIAISAVIGAVLGWMVVDIPGLVSAIWRAASEMALVPIEINWPKHRAVFHQAIWFAACIFGSLLTITLALLITVARRDLLQNMTLHQVLTTLEVLSAIALSSSLFLFSIGDYQFAAEGGHKRTRQLRKNLFLIWNPITLPIWTIVIACMITVGTAKWVAGVIAALAKVVRRFGPLVWAYAHTTERRATAVSAVICGSAWLLSGDKWYIGVPVGILAATVEYRLVQSYAADAIARAERGKRLRNAMKARAK